MPDKEEGIFCGIESIANRYLLDPTWRRKDGRLNFGYKTNCLRLSGDTTPEFFSAERMIHEMVSRIESNISDRKIKRNPSSENWDFDSRFRSDPSAGRNKRNTGPEVTLERAIIQARRMMPNRKFEDKWTYQMPVASGLFGPNTDKSSSIDLVRKHSDGVFDLIELKIGSNNPVFAAAEILRYGLAYAVSRKNAEKIGYDIKKLKILSAKQIRLCVLAPPLPFSPFYDNRYNLAWLEKGLNEALKQFSKTNGYCMSFEFQVLNLDWKATDRPTDGLQLITIINKALDEISQVNWNKFIA